MDLRSVAAVIVRHRSLATVGAIAAFALAFVAAFRLDTESVPPFERRQPSTYESTTRLFVTQKGFPWGRSALQYTGDPGEPPVLEGDPSRFAELAVLYAQLANSDSVRGNLGEEDKTHVLAKVVPVNAFSSAPLPLIDVVGRADNPKHSLALANRVTSSLVSYIQASQARSHIPVSDRVILQVIDPADPGKLVNGPSPALPALVFLTVLFVAFGGVLVADNWRHGRLTEGVHRDASEVDDPVVPRIAYSESIPSARGTEAPAAEAQVRRRWAASAVGRSQDE